MGKNYRGRGRGASRASRGRTDQLWPNGVRTNEKFISYYQKQSIIPEDEWDQFYKQLQEPLPTTFRLSGSKSISAALNQQIISTFVPYLTGLEHEGVPLSPPMPLKWYPNGHAWQLNIAKQHIRKNEAFRRFQHFLVYETDSGNISRQEAVSMIPPLLLDVEPHHFVLDMCAAPGSKSVQLLEAIHAKVQTPHKTTDDKSTPAGLLIANDSDPRRCHMLVHQSLHRIPASGMMVTNHDASQLPGFRLPGDIRSETNSREATSFSSAVEDSIWQPLLFDRVLADVPCSGDGTLRKNPGIWNDWTVGNGIGLHSLQLRILKRGIELLKPGGRLVYSTCSMNPVENEAVVSAALDAHHEMSLVDVQEYLPSLIRRPGLTTWTVLDNDLAPAPHPTSSTAPEQTTEKKGQRKTWNSTLWPNGKEAERRLDLCLRLYPHLQDTGAFFVAILYKAKSPEKSVEVQLSERAQESAVAKAIVQDAVQEVEDMIANGSSEHVKRSLSSRSVSPSSKQPSAKKVKESNEVDLGEEELEASNLDGEGAVTDPGALSSKSAPSKRTVTQGEFKEEPYIYLSPDDEQVKLCLDFFDLHPSFPISNLLVRNAAGAPLRSIYFTAPIVRTLLLSNSYSRMRLISCGVKIFTRQDSSSDGTYRCKWRVMSEGLEVLRPYLGPKRILRASLETLKMLMRDMSVTFGNLEEQAFKDRLVEIESGSCIIEVEADGPQVAVAQKLFLPLWRSKVSVNLMVEKVEKSALSLRLFGEDITPHAAKPKPREVRRAQEEASASSALDDSVPVFETEGSDVGLDIVESTATFDQEAGSIDENI